MILIRRLALVAGMLGTFAVLSSAPAQAQCSAADQCTAQECSNRQANVHPTCDRPRSCQNITDKAEAQRRLQINQDCLAARQSVQQCFSSSDTGHDAAITGVQNAIATCQSKL